jgi:hypothetical protein
MFERSLRFETNGPVRVKIRSQTDQKLFRFGRNVVLPDTGTEISEEM